jgi:hypothetical protein
MTPTYIMVYIYDKFFFLAKMKIVKEYFSKWEMGMLIFLNGGELYDKKPPFINSTLIDIHIATKFSLLWEI